MTWKELACTCPCCDSPDIVQDLEAYITCRDCGWSEYEDTFPAVSNCDVIDMTDFDDRCEHGVWIEDDCDDCNEKLAFDMGVQ